MTTSRYSPAKCLRKLVDLLQEYDLDEDTNAVIREANEVLEFTHERALAAAHARKNVGRNRQTPARIKSIINSKGSLRQIAEKIGNISPEGVRKIRAKYGVNDNKNS